MAFQYKNTDVKLLYYKDKLVRRLYYGDTLVWALYTITWKYQTSLGTWETEEELYLSGATPSRTSPGTVTSGNSRDVFGNWDSLAAVTADRTITAVYARQYNVTSLSGTHCSTTESTGWKDDGAEISWTSDTGYHFGDSNDTTEKTTTVTSGGEQSCSASINKYSVTISSTHCHTGYGDGTYSYGDEIVWYADDYYHFGDSTETGVGSLTKKVTYSGEYSATAYINMYTYTTGNLGSLISSVTCYKSDGTEVKSGTQVEAFTKVYFGYSLESSNAHIVNNTYYDSSHTYEVSSAFTSEVSGIYAEWTTPSSVYVYCYGSYSSGNMRVRVYNGGSCSITAEFTSNTSGSQWGTYSSIGSGSSYIIYLSSINSDLPWAIGAGGYNMYVKAHNASNWDVAGDYIGPFTKNNFS